MKFGSLFAGIGGFDLGLERAGMECAWQVEIDEFCQKVLTKHWPDVPKYRDIREVSNLEPVDVICGGFPCQPFSSPGKREGTDDDRYLWPEMFKIINQCRPSWVIGENVPGIINMALEEILAELESSGYETATFEIPACAAGAEHIRQRVWILGHSNGKPMPQADSRVVPIGKARNTRKNFAGKFGREIPRTYWETHKPPILGVDDGIPGRLDRSRALGNAVVPQIAEMIGNAIMEVEQSYVD